MASAAGARAAGRSPTATCCCRLLLMGIVVVVCSADTARAHPTETVCGSIDIRNNAKNMHKLENCTIIEGYLRINLIDKGVPDHYENMSFPKLREVTGYVLLYRAFGMRSFGKLFPNLAVIRGDTLFANYALVIYQMYQLQEVGLTNLMDIVSGSVLIKDNPSLCYVDTIDWDRIASSGKSDNLIINNKRSDECPNTCPENCPITTKLDEKVSLCWNSHACQKECPKECEQNNLACVGNTCCPPQCLGGCTAPNASSCFACRNVTLGGRCLEKCPGSFYRYMGRRCISEDECKAKSSLSRKYKPFGKECLDSCPSGYTEGKNPHTCIRCEGRCPKVCKGSVIASVGDARKFKGCTYIQGMLEIQILSGTGDIQNELESSLGSIEEIKNYLKVVRSFPLTSLDFLRNLTIIHGEILHPGNYSLVVLDNQNLESLWHWDKRPSSHMQIKRGKVHFHLNPKLCLSKINELKTRANAPPWDNIDVSQTTNGDRASCVMSTFNLTVSRKSSAAVIIQWDNYKHRLTDQRVVLGYVIYYREAKSRNVSKHEGYTACGSDVWKAQEVSVGDGNVEYAFIPHLKPFTQYAVYVRAYMVSSQTQGAESEIEYFMTNATTPSYPTNIKARPKSHSEVAITWGPPLEPNGNITYYIVRGIWEKDSADFMDTRNYCLDPRKKTSMKKMVEEDEPTRNVWVQTTTESTSDASKGLPLPEGMQGKDCCPCDKAKPALQEKDRITQSQIYFENLLHNTIYIKNTEVRKKEEKKRDRRYTEAAGSRALVLNTMDNIDNDNLILTTLHSLLPSSEESTPSSSTVASISTSSTTESVEEVLEEMENGTFKKFYEEVDNNKTYLDMKALRHFTVYMISVEACHNHTYSEGKPCSPPAITNVRTLPLGGADDIDSHSVTIETNNTTRDVFVKWKEPKDPNGLIVSYQIEYKRIHSDSYKKPVPECITREQYLHQNGHILSDLVSGNYTVRIRANSLAGYGNWTEPRYFFVPGSADDSVKTTIITIGIVMAFSATLLVAYAVYRKVRPKTPKHPNYWTSNPDYMSTADWEILDKWEISIKEIQFLRELGHGAFGKVQEGRWLKPNSPPIKCAIKTVNESATGSERGAFLREATVMTAFDCHHIVKLLGVVTKAPVPLVLMELMEQGDLKTFLLSHRPDPQNPEIKPPPIKKRLEMAIQIADGMAYLARKKFVHRDLAARNCMVAADLTVKIGDFGMTRDTYMCDYYRRGDHCRQPVRWMAPESLRDGVFTSQSDVWSYGVVLWEIATLACQPYQGRSNEEVCQFVMQGGILSEPENCPKHLYTMMELCWHQNPNNRPTFINLVEMLIPECNAHFREVSFYFTQYLKEDQEQVDVDTPLTPLRSPSSDPGTGDVGSLDNGDAQNYFPSSLAFNEEFLEMSDINNHRTCCGVADGRHNHRGDCDGETSRGLSIHSNEGSKGMSVHSSDGSKGSTSSGNLANGHVRFPELMTAC